MLRTRVFHSADWAEELAGPWRELAASCPGATPFQTWEWQSLWFRYFGGSRQANIWTCFEGKDLVGLMPFVRSAGAWRTLRPMGCGPSDYLHPIARSGHGPSVAAELAAYLRDVRGIDLADLHQLRESEPLAQSDLMPARSRVLDQATCLVLDLPTSFEAYVSSLSKSLRYDVRRLDRLGSDARIEIADAETAESSMERFFELHGKRWRKRGLPGAFLGARSRRFHTAWARAAAQNGWLHLGTLFLGGDVAGTIYAMRFGSAVYFYQSGFDPTQKAISPGTLLVADAIRRAIGDGLTTFDFLRGEEPYKRRWRPQHVRRNLRVLIPSKGLAGRLAGAWNGAGFQIEAKLRARLEGRGLF